MRGRKSNFVACVHCRQMKLACDGPSKFPTGCSRCTKAGKFCAIDPSFKRTKRRERLQQVEQELREVKGMHNLKEHPNRDITNESQNLQTREHSENISGKSPLIENLDQVVLPAARSIGCVQLSAPVIQDLLTEFYEVYHPSCAILPSSTSFIAYSTDSPFLFWTVMLTAMRRKSDYQDIFMSLVEEIYTLAYNCILPTSVSFHSMQALLLLCYWTPPFDKIVNDPSLSFITMATQIGVRLGLHRPGHTQDFDTKSCIKEDMEILSRIAWVACFINNVTVNCQLGFPPTVRLDRGLLDILTTKPAWLPDTLYCQLHISHHTLNFSLVIGSCEASVTGLIPNPRPIVQLFETELRALESQLSSRLSQADYMCLCACRTLLYILGISAIDNSEEKHISPVDGQTRSQWIVQTYNVVMSTIQAASAIPDQLSKMPTRIWKIVGGATSFLLLLKCSKHCELIDSTALSAGIRQVWDLLSHFEISSNDCIAQSNSVLQRLSNYSETLKIEDKTEELLIVRSRMGYNIIRSTALLVRRKAQKHTQETAISSDDGTNQPVNNNNFDMDDMNFFLDFDWDDALLNLLP